MSGGMFFLAALVIVVAVGDTTLQESRAKLLEGNFFLSLRGAKHPVLFFFGKAQETTTTIKYFSSGSNRTRPL